MWALRLLFIFQSQQKTVTTRKDSQEAKIKTRAMVKGTNKISLIEAKQKSRQRMVKSSNDNVLQDVYENVSFNVKISWIRVVSYR